MTSTTPEKAFAVVGQQLRDALEGAQTAAPTVAAPSTPVVPSTQQSRWAASVLAGTLLQSVGAIPPGAGKALVHQTVPDPALLQDKSFLADVFSIVQAIAPAIRGVVSKDFNPGNAIQEAVANVPAQRRQDKAWTDFVINAIGVLGPQLIQAIKGEKDFRMATDVQALTIPTDINDKGWFEDAFNVVVRVLPMLASAAG